MSLVTLDTLMLIILTVLGSYFVWSEKRHREKDDKRWDRMEESMEEVKAQRAVCIQDFASRMDINNAWKILREQGEEIAALKSWRSTHERCD